MKNIDIYQGQKEKIGHLIELTRRENVREKRILFQHPNYDNIGSDVFGNLWLIKDDGNDESLIVDDDHITIKCNDCGKLKKHNYIHFKNECLSPNVLSDDSDDSNDVKKQFKRI